MSSMEAFHYIKHEHLVLRNKYDLCRFCLLPKSDMKKTSCQQLIKSTIPKYYEEITRLQVHFNYTFKISKNDKCVCT